MSEMLTWIKIIIKFNFNIFNMYANYIRYISKDTLRAIVNLEVDGSGQMYETVATQQKENSEM